MRFKSRTKSYTMCAETVKFPHFNSLKFLLLATILSLGCGVSSSPDSSAEERVQAAAALKVPLRIVVLDDFSTSRSVSRTPPVSPVNIFDLASAVKKRGGELAYGRITAESTEPLHRVQLPIPPTPPTKPAEVSGLRDRTEAGIRDVEARKQYAVRSQAYAHTVVDRLGTFFTAVDRELSRPADAEHTDLWGAISRANLFFTEPLAGGSAPEQILLIVSDGIETAHLRSPMPLPRGVKCLLVNGNGSIGVLSALSPERFESVDAAVRFIVSWEVRP